MVHVQNLSEEVFEHAAQNVAKFTTNGLSQEEIATMRSALCSRCCGTTRREIARYGLRARRIGEANHSGPVANAHTFRQGGNLVTGFNWNATDVADEQM